MEGPTFRERLDYHQYIVFPAGLNAHITANKNNEATKVQKAPLRDADVVVYSLDVAIDSEQLRSVNALLSYVKNFALKDTLMLSRPAIAYQRCKGWFLGKSAQLGKSLVAACHQGSPHHLQNSQPGALCGRLAAPCWVAGEVHCGGEPCERPGAR